MKVLVTARMPEEVISLISREHEVESYPDDPPMERQRLLRSIADKEGLLCTITDRIDQEVLDRAPALKVIANFGVGFEHIDLEAASRRGLPVTNTPGVLTDATAELALALILATARRVVEGDKRTRAGRVHLLGAHAVSGPGSERQDPGHHRPGTDRPGRGPEGRRGSG